MIFIPTILSIVGLTIYFDRRAKAQAAALDELRDKTIEGFMHLHSDLRTLVEHLARLEVISVKYENDLEIH